MWSFEQMLREHPSLVAVDIVVDGAHSHSHSFTQAVESVPALGPYKSRFKRKTLRRSAQNAATATATSGPSIASGYKRLNRQNNMGDRWTADVMTTTPTTTSPATANTEPSSPSYHSACHTTPIGTSPHYKKLWTNTPPLGIHNQYPTTTIVHKTNPQQPQHLSREDESGNSSNSSSNSSFDLSASCMDAAAAATAGATNLSPTSLKGKSSSLMAPRTPRRQPSSDDMMSELLAAVAAGRSADPCTLSPRRPSRQKSGLIVPSNLNDSITFYASQRQSHSYNDSTTNNALSCYSSPSQPIALAQKRQPQSIRRGGRRPNRPNDKLCASETTSSSLETTSQMLRDALTLCSIVGSSSSSSFEIASKSSNEHVDSDSDESTVGSVTSTTYSEESSE